MQTKASDNFLSTMKPPSSKSILQKYHDNLPSSSSHKRRMSNGPKEPFHQLEENKGDGMSSMLKQSSYSENERLLESTKSHHFNKTSANPLISFDTD